MILEHAGYRPLLLLLLLASVGTFPASAFGSQQNGDEEKGAPRSTCPSRDDGIAKLSWERPVKNTDGTSLDDLKGYVIHYGRTRESMKHVVRINEPTKTTYVFRRLKPGTYFFAVSARNAEGKQSDLSPPVSKTVCHRKAGSKGHAENS